jgi:hypothetical protein
MRAQGRRDALASSPSQEGNACFGARTLPGVHDEPCKHMDDTVYHRHPTNRPFSPRERCRDRAARRAGDPLSVRPAMMAILTGAVAGMGDDC